MDRKDLWLLLPEPIRTVPADLVAIIVLTVLTVLAVVLPGVRETPIRLVLGLPLVLFLPGYAFVAALFPEAGNSPTESESSGIRGGRGIDTVNRIGLSLVLSVSIVPLIGLTVNFTPWNIDLKSMLISVSGFTIVCTIVAVRRRHRIPPEARFSLPYRTWFATVRTKLFASGDRIQMALNVALVLSILIATVSVGYALAVPQEGERFTEFYLLTEDDTGELVASDYPEEFVRGETETVIVGIENKEHATIEYTVVVQLQRVDGGGDEAEVVNRQELDRFQTTVMHDETWQDRHTVTPTMVGDDLRLTYLLYKDEPPEEPTIENAYRYVHFWVDVDQEPSEE